MPEKTSALPIAVAGAGVGGLCAAIALARNGQPVVVLEQAKEIKPAPGYLCKVLTLVTSNKELGLFLPVSGVKSKYELERRRMSGLPLKAMWPRVSTSCSAIV